MLCGLAAMKQASVLDCLSFDPFSGFVTLAGFAGESRNDSADFSVTFALVVAENLASGLFNVTKPS
jgi:hypothetical protein